MTLRNRLPSLIIGLLLLLLAMSMQAETTPRPHFWSKRRVVLTAATAAGAGVTTALLLRNTANDTAKTRWQKLPKRSY